MTLKERLEVLESERAINALLVHYCDLVDSGQADRIATEFYHDDIVADYHYTQLSGRQMVHEFYVSGMGAFAESVHSVSNVVFLACDGQTAEITSMLLALHWHGKPAGPEEAAAADFGLVVRSEDSLIKTAEGWRVTKRRARALGPAFALVEVPIGLRRKD